MSEYIVHRSEERGSADHGWLVAKHTFSFGSYYNPERTRFGVLRVLNDDMVAPNTGFPIHPHDNMEIITFPLEGKIQHRDNTGGEGEIGFGEIQVMSAGSGIMHSEYNPSENEWLKLLQIWIFPKERDIEPRYDQAQFDFSKIENNIAALVGPMDSDLPLKINQEAWLSYGSYNGGETSEYIAKREKNGAYLFLIDGEIEILGETLYKRDAIGIKSSDNFTIKANSNSKFIILDVPFN